MQTGQTGFSGCYGTAVVGINLDRAAIEGVFSEMAGNAEALRRLYVTEAVAGAKVVHGKLSFDTSLPEIACRSRQHLNVFMYVEAGNQLANIWLAQYMPGYFALRHKGEKNEAVAEVIEFPTPLQYMIEAEMEMVGELRRQSVTVVTEDGTTQASGFVGRMKSHFTWHGDQVFVAEDTFVLAPR